MCAYYSICGDYGSRNVASLLLKFFYNEFPFLCHLGSMADT